MTTEAGKRPFRLASQRYGRVTRSGIAAIETEAVIAALTSLREKVAGIAEVHRQNIHVGKTGFSKVEEICSGCGQFWPCDTGLILAEIDRALEP
jgi:hypothetical protein